MGAKIEVEVVFNKDIQFLRDENNGFEFLADALDKIAKQTGNHWDFGTGCSALGSCSKEAHKALLSANKSRQRLHAGIWISEIRVDKTGK